MSKLGRQGYDGRSAVAVKHNGAQARIFIQKQNLFIIYHIDLIL